ncbi:uncharacterized protein LOC126808611 [Patella vulgata]|uniref:uncharacterized protein LOC126808611 n=1 Tax=Patella vulgata TaxID=6465 RepID=UPI0024A9024F|nr:uncharacterized protein LOC126808611 [Patella vulgata]
MDVFVLYGILQLLLRGSEAINCHDCTSWSPYCRESVDEPFPAAVATSECKKTDTCFLKKEESGVITRGCADWWMQSQVDINYIGCQTQEVPWMGKQTWCFCQEDYCNGGTVEEIINNIGQRLDKVHDQLAPLESSTTAEPAATINPWEHDWDNIDWNQWTWNDNTGAWESSELNELNDMNNVGAVNGPTTNQNEFDDFHHDYQEQKAHSDDPTWNLWYWHADSDRPQWPTNEVNEKITTESVPAVAEAVEATTETIKKVQSEAASTESMDWGEGWEQLLPWWEGTFYQSTTMPPMAGIHKSVGVIQQHDSIGDDPSQVIDSIPDIDWQRNENSIDNNEIDISASEFFCWDCYSDSPLCGDTVDSTKAHYLGKTACPATNKCFVRHDGDVTYRGCADGWIGSVVKSDYVGCEVQNVWGKEVEWCFCTASLCNGDSMMDIQEKYLHSEPEAFKGTFKNNTVHSRTTRSVGNTTMKLPFKPTDKTPESNTTKIGSKTVMTTTTTEKVASTSDKMTPKSIISNKKPMPTSTSRRTESTPKSPAFAQNGTSATQQPTTKVRNTTMERTPKVSTTVVSTTILSTNASSTSRQDNTTTTLTSTTLEEQKTTIPTTESTSTTNNTTKESAKTRATKAAIKKRESGLELDGRIKRDEKQSSKLFKALLGK